MQLFVERDDSLKLPTVGDLLSRMFREQKIRFTKVSMCVYADTVLGDRTGEGPKVKVQELCYSQPPSQRIVV